MNKNNSHSRYKKFLVLFKIYFLSFSTFNMNSQSILCIFVKFETRINHKEDNTFVNNDNVTTYNKYLRYFYNQILRLMYFQQENPLSQPHHFNSSPKFTPTPKNSNKIQTFETSSFNLILHCVVEIFVHIITNRFRVLCIWWI